MKIPKELKVRDAVIETQRLKMNQMAFQIQLLSRSSSRNMSNMVLYQKGQIQVCFLTKKYLSRHSESGRGKNNSETPSECPF